MTEADDEWLMMDASHINVRPHAAGAKGGNQERGLLQKGAQYQAALAVDAQGMPIRVLVAPATPADCTQAGKLIEGLTVENRLADKGYDSDAIIEQATE